MALKILHIIPYYEPAWNFGGPVRAAADMCREQSRLGHHVSVVTLNWDGKKALFKARQPVLKNVGGVKIHYMPTSPYRPGFYFYSPALRAYWPAVADVDVIHIHTLFNFFTASAFFYFYKTTRTLVMNPHGMLLPPALSVSALRKKIHRFFVEDRLLKRADKVLFTTPMELRESLYPKGTSGTVLPLGLPIPRKINPPLFRNGPRRFAFVGRIHPIKGLPLFIEALHRLRSNASWVFDIWGPDEGGHQEEVEALIRKLRLERHVSFRGSFSHQKLWKLLPHYDLVVLPSIQENFGMSAAEALLAKIPVFVSRGVQLASLIEKSHCGWAAKRDLVDFAGTLSKILHTPRSVYRTMGHRGSKVIQENFSLSSTVAETLRLYTALFRRSSKILRK